MIVGLAADHGGYELKSRLIEALDAAGCSTSDFGASHLVPDDDYPDYVAPLARAVAAGLVDRGIAICASGVGACIVANKIPGARGGLIADSFSAHQGVEDDDLNILCLGAQVTGPGLAWDIVKCFLGAKYLGEERFQRRLAKVAALEWNTDPSSSFARSGTASPRHIHSPDSAGRGWSAFWEANI